MGEGGVRKQPCGTVGVEGHHNLVAHMGGRNKKEGMREQKDAVNEEKQRGEPGK